MTLVRTAAAAAALVFLQALVCLQAAPLQPRLLPTAAPPAGNLSQYVPDPVAPASFRVEIVTDVPDSDPIVLQVRCCSRPGWRTSAAILTAQEGAPGRCAYTLAGLAVLSRSRGRGPHWESTDSTHC